jgi:phage-related protein
MADGSLTFDTKLDSSGFSGGMSKIKDIASTALGVFTGNIMTKAVDGIKNLGQTALDSVSSLEQNVGGVETLFKSSSDTVITNAENAYKTAGMSANTYMETVTGFSASLLQSVGSDTDKAASVADMAIVDMSDNANKMGTSIESIQNAYQGFAKQNYTMLDNLKLGYGGTKSEMERLLSDAEKITGVKYDINNLSDVYNAIHVIQGELDITGTTQKEAATTIEGSMNSAKAAWDNFMNGSGDADELANAFGAAAENIVKNLSEIIPRLTSTIPALISAIVPQIPGFVSAMVPAVVDSVQSLLTMAANAAMSFDYAGLASRIASTISAFIESGAVEQFLGAAAAIVGGLASGIVASLPSLLSSLGQLVTYIVTSLGSFAPDILTGAMQMLNGIIQAIPQIIDMALAALPELITSIINFLVSSLPQIIEGAIQMLNGIIQAIPQIVQAVTNNLPQIITAIITGLTSAVPQVLQGAVTLLLAIIQAIPQIVTSIGQALPQIITAISQGLVQAVPEVFASAKQLLMTIVDSVPEIVASLATAVPDIINGIVNGLVNGLGAVKNAAIELGGSILSGVKEFFGINSPSTVMTEQGDYLVQGMLLGLESLPDKTAQVFQTVLTNLLQWGTNMATQAQSAIQTMLSRVVSILSQLPGQVWTHLVNTVTKVTQWGINMLTAASAAITNMLSKVTSLISQLPGKVWTYLVNTVTKVTQWGTNMLSAASTAITNMISKITSLMSQLPDKIWTYLSQAASKVSQWATDLAQKGAEAAKGLSDAIVNGLKSLPDQMQSIGSNIVQGIWNGISSGWSWLTNKVSNLAEDLLDTAKDALGIASPSKAFRDEVGKWILPGIEVGIERSMPEALREIRTSASALVDEARQSISGISGTISMNASSGFRAGTGGTNIYYDQHVDQTNTYQVPVASPSEVAKTQRQAVRNLVGGVS